MKKSRFTETQIVSILKEADAGRAVKEICRKYGISAATLTHSVGHGMQREQGTASRTNRAIQRIAFCVTGSIVRGKLRGDAKSKEHYVSNPFAIGKVRRKRRNYAPSQPPPS